MGWFSTRRRRIESPRPAPVARLTARGARRSPVRGPSLRSAPRYCSLSFERAKLSRDVARIRRILAACRTSSGTVVRTPRVLTASGKSPISRTDERRIASFEPRSSLRCSACVAVLSGAGLALSLRQAIDFLTGCPWRTERASGARRCPDLASREGPEVPRPARAATPREDTAGQRPRSAARSS